MAGTSATSASVFYTVSKTLQSAHLVMVIVTKACVGTELVIYGVTMRTLLRHKPQRRTKKDMFFFIFSTILLLCCTINLAADCVFGEEWWIVNQNYPGGSEQWFLANAAVWYQTWASAANVLVQLLSDAFLVRFPISPSGPFKSQRVPTDIQMLCALEQFSPNLIAVSRLVGLLR